MAQDQGGVQSGGRRGDHRVREAPGDPSAGRVRHSRAHSVIRAGTAGNFNRVRASTFTLFV